jgi:glucosyl-dolichyl phosphate glucuronosyltransferase
MIKASIIIPTAGNRINFLEDTVDCSRKQNFPVFEYEIIVVDNSAGEKVSAVVNLANQNNGVPVQCIKEKKNGLHYARNAGARQAKGEIIVFIDDDVILPSDWLEFIISPFSDSKVGCAGGKVLPKWEAEKPLWLPLFDDGYLSLLDYGNQRIELKAAGIWGCNMAVRRKTFFEVGGSNVDFFSDKKLIWFSGDGECGLEDNILESGYKIIYEPKAFVYHRIPASRLTTEYFIDRFIFTGIHQSYSRIRKIKNRHLLGLRLFCYSMVDFSRAGFNYCLSLLARYRKIRFQADSCRYFSKACHAMRVILSKKLREHVFQKTYL